MQYEQKKALISDFITLAWADNRLTGSETDFIYRLAERMNVPKRIVDELMHDPIPSKPIFSELERITHFHKLLLLMNVDNETHEKEVITLRNFGLKMGIRPGAIDQILQTMEKYDNKVIPTQELVQIFQSYYN